MCWEVMSEGFPVLCLSPSFMSFSEAYVLGKGAAVFCMVIVKQYVALPASFRYRTNN